MDHRSNYQKSLSKMKYSNVMAVLVVAYLFTSIFGTIPPKVSGKHISNKESSLYSPEVPFKTPEIIKYTASTQFSDTDIILSEDEIKLLYDTISEEILCKKVKSIKELEDLHKRKMAIEETYYENLQKNVDSYYLYLKEKNVLAKEKKALEELLRRINEDLYIKNVKLGETYAKQNEVINAKILASRSTLAHENQLMRDQYDEAKKLIQ